MKNKKETISKLCHLSFYALTFWCFLATDYKVAIFSILMTLNLVNYSTAILNHGFYERMKSFNLEYRKLIDLLIKENKKLKEMNDRLNSVNVHLRGGR